MLKKIRDLSYKHAIPAAFIIFVLFDLLLIGLAQLTLLLPQTLPVKYFREIVLIAAPVALVFIMGFPRAFKNGNFFRGLSCALPFISVQLFSIGYFFLNNMNNPEASWNPWYLMVYGVFSIIGIGIREECIYRATIQNIVAKKYAHSVKGIWITVIVGAIIFGLCHVTNIFFDVTPIAVAQQVVSATFAGILFGAIYLRSGNIWVLILVHTLTDMTSLAGPTFLYNVRDVDVINTLPFSLISIIIWLVYLGLAIFLLRPSKCKQICQSLCFTAEESK